MTAKLTTKKPMFASVLPCASVRADGSMNVKVAERDDGAREVGEAEVVQNRRVPERPEAIAHHVSQWTSSSSGVRLRATDFGAAVRAGST